MTVSTTLFSTSLSRQVQATLRELDTEVMKSAFPFSVFDPTKRDKKDHSSREMIFCFGGGEIKVDANIYMVMLEGFPLNIVYYLGWCHSS